MCGVPTTTWLDGTPYARTRIACSYGSGGNGEPLRFDYQVAANATFTAELTPPQGYDDLSLLDNLVTLSLRT